MCIAILNTKGQIKDKYIKNSWDNNDQGAGLLWNENGKLNTFKTYEYNTFLNKYKELRNKNQVNKIVLHFRIATSGHEKYINLHPFTVNNSLGFVHNGIINGLGDQKYSDTYYFNEMLKQLPSDFIYNETQKEFISSYIGYSKLIFLHGDDNHTIINEHLGHWNGDNWYSNDSYKQANNFYYFGNEKVNKKQSKVIDEISREDYFFYENATNENLQKLSRLLEIDVKSYYFLQELNSLSYLYNTYNVKTIIQRLEEEIFETYKNDNIKNY